MEDLQIIELFFQRSEEAVSQTDRKYGRFLRSVAGRILSIPEDSEEVVNDTYLAAWNKIPPEVPKALKYYLSRITRNLALSRFDYGNAQKRSAFAEAAISELEECIPDSKRLEDEIDGRLLTAYIRDWLDALPKEDRVLFVRRYWYGDSVQTLAAEFFRSGAQMAQKMLSLRRKLKIYLEAKGVEVP